jgi:undecaprenyl-diphosphatase
MDSNGWRDRLESRPLLADHPVALRVSLFLWLLGGALFVALQVPGFSPIVQAIDDFVYELAIKLEFAPSVRAAMALDFLGSAWVTFPVMIAVGVYLTWHKRWEGLTYWVLSMALSQVLIGPIKTMYARPRPLLPLVDTTGYSFPSGHAVAGAAIAVSLVIVLVPAGPRRRNLEMIAVAFAVVMGLSRVYLRAHWLSDVVAGVALGTAVAIAIAVMIHYVVARGRDPVSDVPDQRPPDMPTE